MRRRGLVKDSGLLTVRTRLFIEILHCTRLVGQLCKISVHRQLPHLFYLPLNFIDLVSWGVYWETALVYRSFYSLRRAAQFFSLWTNKERIWMFGVVTYTTTKPEKQMAPPTETQMSSDWKSWDTDVTYLQQPTRSLTNPTPLHLPESSVAKPRTVTLVTRDKLCVCTCKYKTKIASYSKVILGLFLRQ